jgi:hypothetical protein
MIRAIALFALLCCPLSLQAAPKCTRASLQTKVDKYLDALEKGKPSLMPLAKQAKYIENRKEIQLSQGIWQKHLAVDFHRSLLDVETCETFTEKESKALSGSVLVIAVGLGQ